MRISDFEYLRNFSLLKLVKTKKNLERPKYGAIVICRAKFYGFRLLGLRKGGLLTEKGKT